MNKSKLSFQQMFNKVSSSEFIHELVNPWYNSLQNPKEAQNKTLQDLIEHYGKTEYGKNHSVSDVKNIEDFQKNFPKLDYYKLQPYFKKIRKGNYSILLSEPPICWVMTRGSTGVSKVLPVTQSHLDQIFSCGARALLNFALRRKDFTILTGGILNLNFPSNVATMVSEGQEMNYGYSSGTYAKLNPMLNEVSLLPRQEEIDALGSGITKLDWEKRFELVYQKALNNNVTAVMGVTPVILSFAKYVVRKHSKKPKELWKFKALFCTSVKKIQFKYAPKLKSFYGEIPVVEMYTATEGVFGQQLDDLPYITPNYDAYLLEVETGKEVKMLYELKRGEWGRLIISSCLFPRYDIGDLIEAMGENYFRVFGRVTTLTILEHRLYRLLYGWLL